MQTAVKKPSWLRRRLTWVRGLTLFGCAATIALTVSLVLLLRSNKTNKELQTGSDVQQALALQSTNMLTFLNILQFLRRENKVTKQEEDVCKSESCTQMASEILHKMERDVDPCDNFYQFACGNCIKTTQMPENKMLMNTFSAVADNLTEQIQNIITEERLASEEKHFRLANDFFRACMNTPLIESRSVQTLKQIVDTLGGWPVLLGNVWNSDDSWSWQETVKKSRHTGFSTDTILKCSVGVDWKNNTKHIIQLDQPSLTLSREYLIKGLNESIILSYYDYMVDVAVHLGAERLPAKEELRRALQFEIDLANISWAGERRRNSKDLYNLRSIQELQESYPYVEWLHYINALLPETLQVDENEVVNVMVPSFFEDLGNLLKSTDKRIIANYMIWRTYVFVVPLLTQELRSIRLKFIASVTGIKEQQPRTVQCVDMVSQNLPISVGSLYVRKHFQEDSKATALEIANDIRSAFSQILDEVQWMDDKTKLEAKKKLNGMKAFIGYPEEIINNYKLEEYFRELEIDPQKYLESYLNIKVFEADKSFNKLRLSVDKADWVEQANPAVINAFYNRIENSMQLSAGILQGNVFDRRGPAHVNFGAIGATIGHEISHGFDDQGRQFDVDGNLIDWWQPETQKAYLEKLNCIIEQYNNYADEQTALKINGIRTLNENIADNVGIKVSYFAYKKWLAKNGKDLRLPGLKYTSQQMFWISAAQMWCGKFRREMLQLIITSDIHSPNEFRVLGPLRNMEEFSQDFHCPRNSPMNPVHKCQVW